MSAMTYTDLTTTHHLERSMLMIDGAGAPESPDFGAAIGALFAARAPLGGDDVPLEGTYWQRDGSAFDTENPDEWLWTLAVPVPDDVEFTEGAGGARLARQPRTRVVQAEHRGPYAEEPATLAALRSEAAAQGLTISGPHTERYLTDPRSTPPQQLRTLLWYPVEP